MMAEKWVVEGFETLKKFIKEVAGIPVFIIIKRFKKYCPQVKLMEIISIKNEF
ncbi:hypothetical protein [Borreliella valaisiana]|uniref:hypothetical protein n=1 Tax=Borreliella valaisiana TaxID=62088 RepID=UPI001F2A05B8|nr:hypothetical protein [Borreliella valaisiana]